MDIRKKSNEEVYKSDILFQVIEWRHGDEDPENNDDSDCDSDSDENRDIYTIRCFGSTKSGETVSCKINGFTPYYYIKVSNDFDKTKLNKMLGYITSSYSFNKFPNALLKQKCSIVQKKDLVGFTNGKIFKFVKLVFNNYTAMQRSRYLFKNPITIHGITKNAERFKLYESNFEPFLRFCHIQDILTAGWVNLPFEKYKKTNNTASTQIEVEIKWTNIVSMRETKDIANFLQASWDIEVYSHDYTFPDPRDKPNVVYQISTTFKYYNDSKLTKHLLTLKNCEINEPDTIVEFVPSEKQLILRWATIISEMDPDIMYTYNGDGFDCVYMFERAKIHNVQDKFMSIISRLKDIPTIIKKELFSSSAYGDSEYNRFYIPGRLNYDLLIHYKRGMKKYPSYKLDYIANAVLGVGKNNVSVKDIFKNFEDGSPDKIKQIGEYCIMDTVLLQNLVDTQLILITIIQLANVTYVPIGYLTTKGQTIKVFSQILRKARQMNFLAPHTNFNEDNNPVLIKTKNPHKLDEIDINNYISVDCGKLENTTRNFIINGKISEIVDETSFIILSDAELTTEYFHVKIKYNKNEFYAYKVSSAEDSSDDSFTGATVLAPKNGIHYDNVAVLDFASLYPTCIISRNLCYSTMLTNEKYNDIKDVKYEVIEWDDTVEYRLKHTCDGIGKTGKSKDQICGKQAFFEIDEKYYCRIHDPIKKTRLDDEKFQKKSVHYKYTIIQKGPNDEHKGVVPSLLEELYSERKSVKKQMYQANLNGDKLLEDILDSTQLAIKVSLNF
jgi:DNA polymerase elongation subunit (family B)